MLALTASAVLPGREWVARIVTACVWLSTIVAVFETVFI